MTRSRSCRVSDPNLSRLPGKGIYRSTPDPGSDPDSQPRKYTPEKYTRSEGVFYHRPKVTTNR